jgi:hypothetical protein
MQSKNQLLLSKFLFTRGRDTLRGAGLFDAGVAVSMFHDALELLLAATAQEIGTTVSKNQIKFFDWWDLIEKAPNAQTRKLPALSTLRLLNDARVSFKHFGRCPPVAEAQTHQVTCEQFLTQVCTEFFDVDFATLSLASLIPGEPLRLLVLAAEEALTAGDIRTALERCADIQNNIEELQEPLVRIPIRVSYPTGTPTELRMYIDESIGDLRRSISKAIQISLSGHFGVNPIQFAVSRALLPIKTGGGSGYAHQLGDLDAERVQRCIDMQVNYILALGEALRVLEKQ